MAAQKKVLMVWGGWDGHEPKQCVDKVAPVLQDAGCEVELSDTLDAFADTDRVNAMDLLVPCWTMGELSDEQGKGMMEAVRQGVGIAGWHGGMGDAFRGNTGYQFMTGGQFVAHPGGIKQYTVNIADGGDEIMAGVNDFDITSEQYYMHVDPSNQVLATTTFDVPQMEWLHGTAMPVVWKRMWGKGKVFYSSLGHVAADFDIPEVMTIQTRGMLWACRR